MSNEYQFTLMFTVQDPSALWHAAAARCTRVSGLTAEEIEDMIGPREDPAIADCLTALLLPDPIPGCRIIDFELEKAKATLPARSSFRTGSS